MGDKKEDKKKINKKTEKIIKESKILSEDELEELNEYLKKKDTNKKAYKGNKKMKPSENAFEVEGKVRKKKKKKKHKVVKRIFLTILVLILICGIVFGALVMKNGGGVTGLVTTVVGSSKSKIKTLPDVYALCIGVSQNMTDTIMVAKYSPQNQQASLLSIPRDTFCGKSKASASASDKINAIYPISGPAKTMERVNELTGLNIKYYIVVDTKALRDLVDCIGGVYFDVPIKMDYDDSSQNLAIHIEAGYQLLNGTQAEGVCRFRHNNNGTSYPVSYGDNDLGRMRTQREFIKETVKQTMKVSNITKIDDIMKIAQEEVETNIDWNVARDYIAAAVNFNTDNLKSEQLPGSTGYLNDVSFFFADETRTKQVVQSIFLTVNDHSDEENSTDENESNEVNETNTTSNQTKAEKQATLNEAKNAIKSNSKVKVEIINGTGTTTKLDTVKEQLQNMGYKISNTSTSNIVDNTSVICRNPDYMENAKSLQALLGPGSVVSGKENSSIDITIILGKDY